MISLSRGELWEVGCNHGDGAGRVLRATAAIRIAATGNTTAVGPLAGTEAARDAIKVACSD